MIVEAQPGIDRAQSFSRASCSTTAASRRISHPSLRSGTLFSMPAVTAAALPLPRIVHAPDSLTRPVKLVSDAPSGLEGEGFPVRRAFAGISDGVPPPKKMLVSDRRWGSNLAMCDISRHSAKPNLLLSYVVSTCELKSQ